MDMGANKKLAKRMMSLGEELPTFLSGEQTQRFAKGGEVTRERPQSEVQLTKCLCLQGRMYVIQPAKGEAWIGVA